MRATPIIRFCAVVSIQRRSPSSKNYASTSPITRASGKVAVMARYARNDRLADAIHSLSFCCLTASPGAGAYYDELRARGKAHNAALRQLGNRLVGILHGCLRTGTCYDEQTAWGRRCGTPHPAAAA